jgi:hypothetical protein
MMGWMIGILVSALGGGGLNGVAPRGEVYVDARQGSDDRGNGSPEQPWKSIRTAVARMKAGDVCILREGVYRETVVPGDGQTFAAHPGERVVISGCDVVEGWAPFREGILKAPVAGEVREVFVDGERMRKARYPDDDGNPHDTSDWAPTSAERGKPQDTGFGRVTFTAGLQGKNFDGGFFTGLNGRNPFQANMGRIVRTEGDTLTCDRTNLRWHASRPGEFDGDGRGYITDHLACLTAEREWHGEAGTLYFAPTAGKPIRERLVEARTRLWGFDGRGRRGVVIRGLSFHAASVLLEDATDCILESCDFEHVSPWGRYFDDRRAKGDPEHYTYGNPEDGTSGITIGGSGNVVRGCRVAKGWGALITVRGRGNTVENNLVENAGWQCREFAVNIVVNGADHRILRNTVRTSTAMLIVMIDIDRVPTTAPVIRHNDCRDYGHVMLDGGTSAIYMNGNNDLQGADISYNFIADNRTRNPRVSCGIYLDDGANHFRVHHNVVVGNGLTRSGLFTHRGDARMMVAHNTFWGQKEAGWISAVWEGRRDAASMIFRNNLSSGTGFAVNGIRDPITQDHNRDHVPAGDFVNVDGLDFRLKNPNSPAVDAGVPIPGISEAADGKPHLGAFERGVPWKAGSDLPPR